MARTQRAEIRVYSIDYCPFCEGARELLQRQGIDYVLEDLSDHPDRRSVVAGILPGHSTVPLVLIDGDPIGGFTELEELHASGELEKRVFGQP